MFTAVHLDSLKLEMLQMPVKKWMNKVISHSRLLLNNKQEWITDTCKLMGEKKNLKIIKLREVKRI